MDAQTLHELFGEPISVYTRAQALEDGILADVSEWGQEYGFRVPVAMTAALWATVDIDGTDYQDRYGESTRGRAHDVLWLTAMALRAATKRGDYLAQFPIQFGLDRHIIRAVIDGDGVTIGYPEDF